jgi:hypothetical protein
LRNAARACWRCVADPIALVFEHLGQQGEEIGIVLDEKDVWRRHAHLTPVSWGASALP